MHQQPKNLKSTSRTRILFKHTFSLPVWAYRLIFMSVGSSQSIGDVKKSVEMAVASQMLIGQATKNHDVEQPTARNGK